MDVTTANLQYGFLEYFYYGNTKDCERILCDCLNQSSRMKQIGGSEFKLISEQHNRQNDVEALEYSLDFKLMVSESLAEFQSLSTKKAYEIEKGVYAFTPGKRIQQKAVMLLNMCKSLTKEKLSNYRLKTDKASRSTVRFFDGILDTPKNLFVFFPAYIQTIDQSLPADEQYSLIQNELSETLKYIYIFRKERQPSFDTFFAYITNIPFDYKFTMVINSFTESGLQELDKVDYFSLPSVQEIAKIYVL